jgi:hypothetical protein
MEIILPRGSGETRDRLLLQFAKQLQTIQEQIPFRVSSRGWCYQLEPYGLSKGDFNKTEAAINECRATGYLPIDFTAEEEGRRFHGVEIKDYVTPAQRISSYARSMEICEQGYTPDWWKDERFDEQDHEEFYIQILVEKIDLVSLFKPVVEKYKIPIATSKGWSSMLQRAEYARRFREAEDRGLQCVLLYCGDFDPDGLRISDRIRKNLADLKNIVWNDGEEGYDPKNLIIDRFGLNYQFILDNNLTWIDNKEVPPVGIPKLITGSGKNLADPRHKNHHMPYIQTYISSYGVRKCEANALVIRPAQAHELCKDAVEKYLGTDALGRIERKETTRDKWFDDVRKTIKIGENTLAEAVGIIRKGLTNYDENQKKKDGSV